MSYKEVSTQYPSMINSFAHPHDNVTKLLEVLPDLGNLTKMPQKEAKETPTEEAKSTPTEEANVTKVEPSNVTKVEPSNETKAPTEPSNVTPTEVAKSTPTVKKPRQLGFGAGLFGKLNKTEPQPKHEPEKDKKPPPNIVQKMKDDVKEITSILKQKSKWNLQKEKTGTLQHQLHSHRAYVYDHNLVKIDDKKERVEITMDRINGANYFKYIKGNKDLFNEVIDTCGCVEYEQIMRCSRCKKLKSYLGSRSTGRKYDELEIPKWNLTFRGGGLRSENRVFHGTYKVRAKTSLQCNCMSFITFSMLLPIKDPHYPKLGFWEEIALGFSAKGSRAISLFIKSTLSETEKKELVIPIEPKTKNNTFSVKEYNNYTLEWLPDRVTLSVNSREVYSSKPDHPVPQLPGYTYMLIRPNYDTDSVALIKNIKKEIFPNIHIKSFSYTPLKEE